MGIEKSQYQNVFKRFYRINNNSNHSNEISCGIGLSIVRHIVDLHKATICLKPSRFKTGLMVHIELPKRKDHG